MSNLIETGLYFHWPFCKSKCPYCDFNVHVSESIDQAVWKDAYLRALQTYADKYPERRIVSIYFGGGTPSLMPVDTVSSILKSVNDLWSVAPNIEVTLEANPTSVEAEKFRGFKDAGVNRLSLGVQAMNDSDLKFLGRTHDVKQALEAIDTARKIFDRYSFDLIYARPKQSLQDWEAELTGAIKHSGGHMSLYQLTIERSTPFYMDHARGKFTMPPQDLAADFYNLTWDVMEAAGLPVYEVSNHAAPGQQSIHNRVYWEYGDYFGIGPGAHGRIGNIVANNDKMAKTGIVSEGNKVALRDHHAPDRWLELVQSSGTGAHPGEVMGPEEMFAEALMVGLRLREGVTLAHLKKVSGVDPLEALEPGKLQKIKDEGWLADEVGKLRLTREGLLRLNSIVKYLLG
jgi:putative oxygen-independent coproporphyrinogen III oxidase